jgi:uncharacterized membrane protein YfcA
MVKLFLIVATGAFAQFVDGALGMGYGTTASSVLIAAGLLPALVSASVHTTEIFTSLVSGASHVRFGNVDKGIVVPLATSGMAGGILGAYALASIVSSIDMKPIVGALLLLLGVGILLRALQRKVGRYHAGRFSKRLLLPLGFVGGALDAIGGGGWGPVATATLVTRNQTTPRYITGSVNVAEFFVTMAIVLTFGLTLGFENFMWHITLPLMLGGMLIAPVAAYTSSRVSPVLMGVAVGLLLVILNVKTVSQSLSTALGFPLPSYVDVLVITLAGLLVALLVIGVLFRSKKMPAGELGVEADD